MWRNFTITLTMVFLAANTATAQAVARAFCGKDGKAHLVFATGATRIMPSEESQVGCEDLTVAKDKHTVAWSMLVDNCCTSYPIAASVVLFKDGTKVVISSPQAVWDWRFIDDGKKLAMLSGPVHGGASEALLFDTHSGEKLASWDGTGTPPPWAFGWEDQFESGQK